MNVPRLVFDKVVDDKGMMTASWVMLFSQLLQQLQLNFSQQGLKPPALTTTQITALNGTGTLGAIVFNTTTGEFMGNKAGTFVNI